MIDIAASDTPRWVRRLDEYGRMLELFARTDALRAQRGLSEAEEAGLVQFFELSVDLGWKTMAGWLAAEGVTLRPVSPLNVVREAARLALIDDPDSWADAIERRNVIAHTYDQAAFRALIADAGSRFLPSLRRAHQALLAVAEA